MTMIPRKVRTTNPPYGGCDCDCHFEGQVVMHCFPCCTPEKGAITLENAPPLFGGLKPSSDVKAD